MIFGIFDSLLTRIIDRPDAQNQIRPEDGEGKPHPITTQLFGPRCRDNMNWFEDLCQYAGSLGIDSVRFAFVRLDPKVLARFARHQIEPVQPDKQQRKQIAAVIAQIASKYVFL